MTQIPVIHTDRLTLRPHKESDFDAHAALWAAEDSRFMGGPLSRNDAWCAFCADHAAWDLLGYGGWVIERRGDETTVGQVGLNRLPDFPERELGWVVYADHRGHGYATEAARAARAHAYDVLNWTTVVSYVDPENTASKAVAERLGARIDADAKGPDPEDLVYRHPAPEDLQ